MICRRPAKIKARSTGNKMLDAKTIYPASVNGTVLVPCGQCLNCRINQSRVWTNRILLENCMHKKSAFVTLTYSDKHLPDPAWVHKPHLQKYLKRLRYYIEPIKIRYFGVGEYGPKTFRPHYHIILFGLGLENYQVIKKAWPYADPEIGIDVGEVTPSSARYITGYVTNKIYKIKEQHPVNYGKADEFMICSTGKEKGDEKGGIGKEAACQAREHFDQHLHTDKSEDLTCLLVGPKKYPLGRYLKQFTEGKQSWERRLLNFKVNQERLRDATRNQKQPKESKKRRPL